MALELTDRDAAYLAGLVDGDGSIFMSKRTPFGKNKTITYRVFLGIANQNKDLLEHLSRVYDKAVVYWQAKNYRAGRVTWEGPGAIALIERILPFLVGKQEQAKLAIQFPCIGSGHRNPEAREKQANLFTQIRTLNQKWSMGKTRKDSL